MITVNLSDHMSALIKQEQFPAAPQVGDLLNVSINGTNVKCRVARRWWADAWNDKRLELYVDLEKR